MPAPVSMSQKPLVLTLAGTPDRLELDSPPVRTRADDDLSPFASLESAQEYIGLLGTVVDDTRNEIQQEIDLATEEHAVRRQEALFLVNYKLTQLRHQLTTTGHLLNDLRMLRRLLLGERNVTAVKPRAGAA
jgi:RNase P/RNase MRP subunit p29